MKIEGRMTYLTTEKAREWKAGKWKYTYTNFFPEKKRLYGVSGDYVYVIRLIGLSHRISFNKVPKGYRKCLNKDKPIYKTAARLEKVRRRDLRKKGEQRL